MSKGAPLPANETARLAALASYNILDTPAEEEFDDFTQLAAQICATPIALVSLLDAQRQWFKSRVGLDAAETDREIAFCGHAILGNELLEVRNALEDPRFSNNPLVTGAPDIRFYAGTPLTTADGFNLGTLCVIDRTPRQLNPQQRSALARLGRQVVRQLELRKSAEQHAHQLALQRAMISSAGIAMLTTDPEGRINSVNQAAAQLLEYSSTALLGQSICALHNPLQLRARARLASIDDPFTLLVNKAQSGERESLEWIYLRSDGRPLPVQLSVSAIRSDTQTLQGYLFIARDLLQREQLQQRLQHLSAQLPGVVYQFLLRADGTSCFPYASAGIKEVYGCTPEQALNSAEAAFAVLHPADVAAVGASIEQSALQLSRWQAEYRVNHPTKGLIWLEGRASPERRDDGSTLWHGFITEISARKAEHAELDRQQEINRRLLATFSDAIVACDTQGQLTLFNDSAGSWYGVAPGDAPITPIASDWAQRYGLFTLDGQTPLHLEDMPLLRALAGERVRNSEHCIVRHGFNTRYVSVNADPLFAANGQQTGAVAVLHDITERRHIEQLQRDFVSTVSHELRTPLTSINGSLGLIIGGALGPVPASMAAMLSIAQQNSQRLSLLINDLLDMDKLLAGKMDFNLCEQPLLALLNDALRSNQGYAEQYQVSYQLQPFSDVKVTVDGLRLQQVLANFLSNACKFSPAGSQINLRVDNSEGHVRVNVCDQGSGVPPEFQARIFQKFSQADASSTRQQGGTGLGLAISKELIERMGGSIGFDSSAKGAIFWFELPVQSNHAE
jgi:PAS domain S-box-containing protein